MATPQNVLVNFQGDASNFIAAINQMMTHLQALNTALGATSNANVKVATTTQQASQSQDKMKASTVALGSVMGQLALKSLQWGKSMMGSFAETGVHVRKLQEVMGGTAEEMSKLIAVFGAYKVPFDAIVVSYRTFAIQAVTNTKAFRDLGLSMKDANGVMKPAVQMFGEAADALNRIGNDTERTAAAGVLFGRRYKELLPVLALGSEGIKKVGENARRLGIILDEEGVKKAVDFTQSQTQMNQAMQGLSFTIMTKVVPSLTAIAKTITQIVVGFSDFLKQHPGIIKGLEIIGGLMIALWVATKTYAMWQAISNTASTVSTAYAAAKAAGLGTVAAAYGAVAVAAGAAATAELAVEAFSVVGLVAAGAAVAGLAVLISKFKSMMNSAKMEVPAFSGFTGGDESYVPTTGATGKTKQEIAHDKAVERAKKHLDAVKKFWDAQVDAAKDALSVAKNAAKKYEDIVKDISEGIQKSAEVPSLIEESFAKYMGPQNLVRAFQKKVDDAREFLGALTRLKDLNLSPDILLQLAAAGPQQGLEAAKVLLSDTSTIGQLNALQSQLTTISGTTAVMVGGYVAPESQAASGSIAGLTTALTSAEASRTTNVDVAQRAYDKVNVTVNANTNASPAAIAKDVAFGVTTGYIQKSLGMFGKPSAPYNPARDTTNPSFPPSASLAPTGR